MDAFPYTLTVKVQFTATDDDDAKKKAGHVTADVSSLGADYLAIQQHLARDVVEF